MTRLPLLPFLIAAAMSLSSVANADEKERDGKVRDNIEPSSCSCPKEGEWKVQNLEGWMNCTGPVNIKRSLPPVKDEGTIWVLGEESCKRLFGEASSKQNEDMLMKQESACHYKGTVNGDEDGVAMVINVSWTLDGSEFIKGEMHSNPSLQGMMCEYFRPFEITYDSAIPEKDYEKRRKKMQKKLEKIRNKK